MGLVETRYTADGEPRCVAKYRNVRGRKQTAGTFSTEKKAEKAWQTAEVHAAEGRIADPQRGRQRFKRHVEQVWLPHHVMEASTREGYTYQIGRHITPWFGGMKMIAWPRTYGRLPVRATSRDTMRIRTIRPIPSARV
jgi:hypothetical protein